MMFGLVFFEVAKRIAGVPRSTPASNRYRKSRKEDQDDAKSYTPAGDFQSIEVASLRKNGVVV